MLHLASVVLVFSFYCTVLYSTVSVSALYRTVRLLLTQVLPIYCCHAFVLFHCPGNAFTGTVVQAAFLASLITAPGWDKICKTPSRKRDVPAANPAPESKRQRLPKPDTTAVGEVTISPKRQRVEDQREDRPEAVDNSGASLPVSRSCGQPSKPGIPIVRRRIRGKQHPTGDLFGKQGGSKTWRIYPTKAGTKKTRQGKKKCLTIWDKEKMFEVFDKLKEQENANIHKHFKSRNFKGYFKGCFNWQHWGKSRQKYHWTLLCKIAPRIAQKNSEVTNHIRKALGMKVMKYGPDAQDGLGCYKALPPALLETVEELLLQRIELGEPINAAFAEDVVTSCIEEWNAQIDQILEEDGRKVKKISEGVTRTQNAIRRLGRTSALDLHTVLYSMFVIV